MAFVDESGVLDSDIDTVACGDYYCIVADEHSYPRHHHRRREYILNVPLNLHCLRQCAILLNKEMMLCLLYSYYIVADSHCDFVAAAC